MDNLRIYIVTYNVATNGPGVNLRELLGLCESPPKSLPDLYVIGLQEVKSQPHNMVVDALFDDPWTNSFRETLSPFGYVKVKTVRLIGIVLTLFCLRKHLVHLRDMESVVTKTGLMGLWGNKGCVTLRLQLYGCSLCFVNCHLAPHDHLIKERIDDYNTIIQNQQFHAPETTSIFFHDYVFWFGDLNFRLESNPQGLDSSKIVNRIRGGSLDDLLEADQLLQVMNTGEAFSELTEAVLTFPPTYKFNVSSNSYDLKRRPAWTDRILYKVNHNAYENVLLEVDQKSYMSFPSYLCSDHKPVVAEFILKVFSDYSERLVKLLTSQVWYMNETNTATCILGTDVFSSNWDWVAIYHENFSNLDDYLGYIYVPASVEEGEDLLVPTSSQKQLESERIVLSFHENFFRSPGRYQLVYFSQNSASILGISRTFSVEYREGDCCELNTRKDW